MQKGYSFGDNFVEMYLFYVATSVDSWRNMNTTLSLDPDLYLVGLQHTVVLNIFTITEHDQNTGADVL